MFLDQAKLSLVSTNANELTPGFLVSVMMNLYRGVEISQYRITVSGHITHVSTYVTWTRVRVSCVGACYYVGVGPLKSNMTDTWIPLIGKARNKIYV